MKKRSGFQIMIRLIVLVKHMIGFMLAAILMGLIGHLCAAFITILGGYAILELLGLNTEISLGICFSCMLFFALLRAVLRYIEQSCNHYIAFKLLAIIRDKVFRALRRLAPAKLEGKNKGNLISVITSDIELLEVFYAHTISPIAIAVLFSGFLCVYIGAFHRILGVLALVAYLVIGCIVPLVISKISGEDGNHFRRKSGELSSFVLDSLRGLPEVLQFGYGEKRLEKMNENTKALSEYEESMKLTAGRNVAVTNTLILVFDLAMLFTSAGLYNSGVIGFDGVLLSTVALFSSFGPVVALANLGSTLQNTFAAGNRVLDILEESPFVEDVEGKEPVEFAGVSVSHVNFAYGETGDEVASMEQEKILEDVSLEIPEHSVIGIVGKSGSGKSTLLKLLMRFWKVDSGEVKVSGQSVEKINTTNLRDMESFVTQDTHLFQDSIKNNLLIAKLDAMDEEIVTACKKASVHDFIMSLPKGYDTLVGELGDTLSGGEKQRIGLARAFLHNAPFMLLDEPTSNLDSLNEAVILKALHEERADKTVVLVSHRESTMRIAECVYSVEDLSKVGRRMS